MRHSCCGYCGSSFLDVDRLQNGGSCERCGRSICLDCLTNRQLISCDPQAERTISPFMIGEADDVPAIRWEFCPTCSGTRLPAIDEAHRSSRELPEPSGTLEQSAADEYLQQQLAESMYYAIKKGRVTHVGAFASKLPSATLARAAGTEEQTVDLSNLTELSESVAELLSHHRGDLKLDGMQVLSDTVAEVLSRHQGVLSLNGITTISGKAAEALSRHRGVLVLTGLTQLSDAAAEALSRHQGELWLTGLTELSDDAAKTLSNHGGVLGLNASTDSPPS